MTTLYKKDSKDKLRVLNIYTDGAELIQTAGILGGALVENRKTCKAKNVGRANETSPEAQAFLEMESKIAEKLKEDYFLTVEEATNIQVMLPMLAKDYKDHNGKINWSDGEAYLQPKLDGMRALGVTGPEASLTSRTGSPIETMEHILEDLRKLPSGFILDGELYAHGLSFQENMTIIKKVRPGQTESVKFHVYDMVNELGFTRRYEKARTLITDASTIESVPTTKLSSEAELKAGHVVNIGNGYEGSIVRWGNKGYKINGRSENLLKYKDFKDLALVILDIEPADQRPEWGVPVFYWKGAKDDKLRSGMKFSHAERKEFLLNKHNYIGKTAEVRFFEYSDEGVPRFPVTVGIRLDK